jgi:very-short-patch-repair endonuclease
MRLDVQIGQLIFNIYIMKKLTQEEFKDKCREVHVDKYDYSLVEFKNVRTKIKIICKEHGVFEQTAKNHKEGQGCPRCSGNKNLTRQEFIHLADNKDFDYSLLPEKVKIKSIISIIKKSNNIIYHQWACHHLNKIEPTKMESTSLVSKLRQIHNNLFDYEITKESYYATDRIKIKNNITSDTLMYRIDRHLQGMKPNKVTLNSFLLKSSQVHGDVYDYSLVKEIKGNNYKVKIICKKHGVFEQRISNHINLKDGCPKCVGKGRWNNEVLKEEFFKVHLDRYDYSKVNFEGIDSKVSIICKQHGIFNQNIHKHLKGQGCPECSFNSKGEEYIKSHLEELDIEYIRQHSFDSYKYINKLNFDFYLPELNTCLEFDGIQHFKPIKDFGGEEEFEIIKKRDECKNKWCLENNVKLVRIRYDQINIIRKIIKDLSYKK